MRATAGKQTLPPGPNTSRYTHYHRSLSPNLPSGTASVNAPSPRSPHSKLPRRAHLRAEMLARPCSLYGRV
jgi:hypothetical protein